MTTKLHKRRLDIGLIWAKYVNTWGQIGAVAGTINFLMMLGVFYTTTLRPAFNIPLWLYTFIVIIGAILSVTFVLNIGISGYYRFFSNNSELSAAHQCIKDTKTMLEETRSELVKTDKNVRENDRKLGLVLKHLGINEEATRK